MELRIRIAAGLLAAVTLAAPATPALAAEQPTASTAVPAAGEPETTPSPAGTSPDTSPDTRVDPAVGEPAGEGVPETDQAVPPKTGAYSGQGEMKAQEVLWSSVREAERKLAEATAIHESLVETIRVGRHQRKQLELQLDGLNADSGRVAAELKEAEERLVDRAVNGFVADEAVNNELIGSLDAARYDRVLDMRIRQTLLGVVMDSDDQAIADYLALRGHLEQQTLDVVDGLRWLVRSISAAEMEAEGTQGAVDQAADELEAFKAGSAIYIAGVVFPVLQPYSVPLIDSYGFPRMPGTADEHWHEGIDIFAPAGTPLVAGERGVVTKVGSGRLGGLTVWLRGESGADWYYAHLQSHAAGLTAGQVVEAGDLLGYVGNTGNAISTPPHLHMEIHPNGGDPVNPYPLMKVVSDRDLAGATIG